MGKIVAIGGGCYDDSELRNIFEKIVSLSGKKNPNAVFLPTASFDNWSEDDGEIFMLKQVGCRVTTLCLSDTTLSEDSIRSAILNADLIYAGGGHLAFLMNTFIKSKAAVYLKEAFEKGVVLSGYSSGAMCWFERGYDDCAKDHSFIFVDCLGILPGCHCPHYENENWHKFSVRVSEQSLSATACDNGAALIYDDGKWSTMHGNDGGEVWFFDKNQEFKELCLSDKENLAFFSKAINE